MKKLLVKQFRFFALILVLAGFSNCKEDPTKAVITVLFEDKKPASGAKVLLHARDVAGKPGEIEDSLTTDAAGMATFEFKNEAVFTIEATLPQTVYDTATASNVSYTFYGTGTVRLKPHETVEQTVTIR